MLATSAEVGLPAAGSMRPRPERIVNRSSLLRLLAAAGALFAGTVDFVHAQAPAAAPIARPPQYFARKDAERSAAQARKVAEDSAAALQPYLTTKKQLDAATLLQQRLAGRVAAETDSLKPLEPLKASVAQLKATLQASQASAAANAELLQKVQASGASVTQLTTQLEQLLAQKQAPLVQLTQQKAAADQQVTMLTAALKPLAEAKAKLELPIQAAVKTTEAALARMLLLERDVVTIDPKQTRLVKQFKHARGVLTCRFDPEGEAIWAGSEDQTVRRWDLITDTAEGLPGHSSWVSALAFTGERMNLISAGYEGKLLWQDGQQANSAPLRTVDAHQGFIRSVAMSVDGKYLATGGNDQIVKVWNVADGSPVAALTGHEAHVYHVAFAPDGQHLLSGDLMGVVKQWKIEGWQPVRNLDAGVLHRHDDGFQAHVGGVRAIAFSPDGQWVAFGGIGEVTNAFAGVGKPMVVLVDWVTGKSLRVLESADAFQGSVWGLRFTSDSRYLVGAGGGNGGAIWFWDPEQVKSVHMVKLDQVARDLDMHPDGLRLATPMFDGTVRVFDMAPAPVSPAPAAPAK